MRFAALLLALPLAACVSQVKPPPVQSDPQLPIGEGEGEGDAPPPKDDPPDDPPPNPAVCGDGVVQGGEVCDGHDLGDASCDRLGFSGGTVSCDSHCQLDLSACTSAPVDPPPPVGDATPIAAPGGTVTLQGSLDLTDPSWTRPGADCTASSSTSRHYDVFQVVNNTGSAQTITVSATFTGDGYLHAYGSVFDPASPESGCLAGNDDGDGTQDSRLEAVAIQAGAVVTLVVSTFAADTALGPYTLDVVTDDGSVTPPPDDNVCGDDVAAGAEVCDGGDVGGDTCGAHGFNRGSLGCDASCAAVDAAGCFNVAGPNDIAPRGSSIVLSGNIADTDGTWSRPSEDCGAGAADATRYFDAFEIVNRTGQTQALDVTATFSGDGYLHAFTSFDPRDPTTGCVAGDDDFNGSSASQLTDVAIGAGQTLTIVVSTFAADAAIGTYSLQVLTKQPTAPAVCGNGVREGNEVCDGASVGSSTCQSRGHQGGTLSCNSSCSAVSESSCWDLAPAVPIAGQNGSIALGGSLTSTDPRIDRVSATCSGSGAADHPWDGYRIVNNTGAAQSLTVTASWSGGDGFLLAYHSSFDAESPLTGCITGNDDFGGASGSQITDLAIAPGETLVLVASTFAGNATVASYDIEVATNGPPPTAIGNAGITVQLAGSLDASDPTFERLSESCSSTGATGRRFDAYRVKNTTSTSQRLTLQGNWSGDGFLFVFGSSFNPASPAASCRLANDDFNGQDASRITGVNIAAGETVVVVASTFAAGATLGAYTIDVLTEGTATLAPPGGSITTAGALHTSDPQWNRPSESCTDDGGTAENHYDTYLIKNASSVERDLNITANWGSGDGFLVVYFGAFDPADGAGLQCIEGDDDFNGVSASRLADVIIFPGETLTVVATTYAAAATIPAYTVRVDTLQ